MKGWKLSKDVNRKHKVYLLAKIKCMKDYIKHCIRENNPDHVIIHSGTNKLGSERQAEIRDKFIIDVAKSITTNTCAVSISRIVHTE